MSNSLKASIPGLAIVDKARLRLGWTKTSKARGKMLTLLELLYGDFGKAMPAAGYANAFIVESRCDRR